MYSALDPQKHMLYESHNSLGHNGTMIVSIFKEAVQDCGKEFKALIVPYTLQNMCYMRVIMVQ